MKLGKVVVIFGNWLPELGIVLWVNGYLEVVAGEVPLPHPCSMALLGQLFGKLKDVGPAESRCSIREDRTWCVVVECKRLEDEPLLPSCLCRLQRDNMGKHISKRRSLKAEWT